MAVSFPTSPSSGDTFDVGSIRYQWSGSAWKQSSSQPVSMGVEIPFTKSDGTTSDPIKLASTVIGDALVNDTTPQLGGSLDVNGNAIVSTSNANISITPNGSGNIILDGITFPNSDGSANQILKTNGSGVLSWAADSGGIASVVADTSPQLGGNLDVNGQSIVSDASNENIPITPHGTGSVVISKLSVTGDTSLDGGSFVFNESGADKDFRIEGDTEANLFVADASTNRIGIGTAAPTDPLSVAFSDTSHTNGLVLYNTNTAGYSPAVRFESDYGSSRKIHGAIGAAASGSGGGLSLYSSADNSALTKQLFIEPSGDILCGSNYTGPSSGATVKTLRLAKTGAQGNIANLELVGQQSSGTSSSVIGNIDFLGLASGSEGAAVNARAIIRAETESEYRNSALTFYTQPTSGAVAERMRIKANGDVNIASLAQFNVSNTGVSIGTTTTPVSTVTKIGANGGDVINITGSNGNVGIANSSPNGKLHVTETGSLGLHTTYVDKTNGSAVGNIAYWSVNRADSTAYNFMSASNSGGQSMLLTGQGNGLADGTWQDGSYDYAEYFESVSGEASELGRSVVLDDGKMRYYDASTDDVANIIGITRPKKNAKGPSAHNGAWFKWHDKFMTDDWGQYIMENVTVWSWDGIDAVEASEAIYYADSDDIPDGKSVGDVKTEAVEAVEGREEGGVYERDELAKDSDWTPPVDATSSTQSVRKQNPDYDPALADDYKSREDRDEWWLIGLLGQVQIKANEPTNPRWIKMRQISDAVDMWMIR